MEKVFLFFVYSLIFSVSASSPAADHAVRSAPSLVCGFPGPRYPAPLLLSPLIPLLLVPPALFRLLLLYPSSGPCSSGRSSIPLLLHPSHDPCFSGPRPVFVDPPGLEPGTTEPKSAVLPLHHGSKMRGQKYMIFSKPQNQCAPPLAGRRPLRNALRRIAQARPVIKGLYLCRCGNISHGNLSCLSPGMTRRRPRRSNPRTKSRQAPAPQRSPPRPFLRSCRHGRQ